MFNIYVPQNYRLNTYDNNLLTVLNLVYAKINQLLDLLELDYVNSNSLFDRHQGASFTEYKFEDLNLLNDLGNSEISRKVFKNFNKQEHETAVKRLCLTPEYLYSYYRYLASIIIESNIKTSKFIDNYKDKADIVKTCIKFILKDIDKNSAIKEIDNILSLLSFKTVVA